MGRYLGAEAADFERLDARGDGTLNESELRAAGECETEVECETLMGDIDNNGAHAARGPRKLPLFHMYVCT